MLEIELAGSRLVLLAQRAAYLPEQAVLLVADAHIGKAATFRRLGVPVPQGTTSETLQRLGDAVAASGARRIVFLGDLLHSRHAEAEATTRAFARWREAHAALRLTLVRGNHDRHAGDPPPAWEVETLDGPLDMGRLSLAHHPDPVAGRYVLAGHVHPCAVLCGRAHQRLRLPCFHFGAAVGVLPAFGAFTGMHALPRAAGDRVFVVAGERVLPLPGGH